MKNQLKAFTLAKAFTPNNYDNFTSPQGARGHLAAWLPSCLAAFTLAEVLITLGIIGVVAAITMPSLISKYREKVFVEKLKETYSIFSQAHLMALNENGPAEYWDLGEVSNNVITMDNAVKLYDIIVPHLKKVQTCREEAGCFADSYKTLSGGVYGYSPKEHSVYARGILANGVSFAVTGYGSCSSYHFGVEACGVFYVDLNGTKGPNQAGVDYFGFIITSKSVIPMGLPGWIVGNGYTCEYQGTTSGNGTGCTAWVLTKQNMDYLRRDISGEWD